MSVICPLVRPAYAEGMRTRATAVGFTAVAVFALTACGPGTADPTPAPTADVETPAELVLPADATVGLVGILTAPNGATADLAVIVHASLPWMVPEAADAIAATVAWCAGEVDEGVIEGRGYTFTQVDIRLTAREGDWPDGLTLAVWPQPNPEVGSTNAATPVLRQVDVDPSGDYGDAVPHCRQPTVIDGLGEGSVYLGIPQDIAGVDGLASFTAWTIHRFGVTAMLPGDLGATDVEFSSCASALTELGEEFGASPESWVETFTADGCVVGAS